MSVRVSSACKGIALPPSQKLVLVMMADYADHDGRNVRPSVGLLARITGLSERQVQRNIRDLVATGILVPERDILGGRGRATEYRIDTTKGHHIDLKGDAGDTHWGVKGDVGVTDYPLKGDIHVTLSDPERVTYGTVKGDICDIKGDTHVTPTVRTVKEPLPPYPPPGKKPDDGFREFWVEYPKHEDRKATEEQWRRLKPDDALRAEILAAVRAQKAGRKWQDNFVKAPFRWLRDRNWEDEVEAVRSVPTNGQYPTGMPRAPDDGPPHYGVIRHPVRHYGTSGYQAWQDEIAAAKAAYEARQRDRQEGAA